jgi:hypothetical protein
VTTEATTRALEPFRRAVETFCAEESLETLTKSDVITRTTLHMVQQSFIFAPAVQHLTVSLQFAKPATHEAVHNLSCETVISGAAGGLLSGRGVQGGRPAVDN